MPTIDVGDVRLGTQAAEAGVQRVRTGVDGLAVSVQGLSQAGHAVVGLASQFLAAAESAEAHQRALLMLGGAYEQVRAATNGAVSAEQALRMQQELTQAGLRITGDELATLTRTAREHANNALLPLDQVLGQLTEAMRTGAPDAMARFGVALHQGTTRGQAMDAALHQLHARQAGLRPQAQTLAETHRDLGRAMTEATDAIVNMFTRGGGLSGLIQELTDRVRNLARELRDPQFTNHLMGRDEHGQEADAANAASNERYTNALRTLAGAGARGLPRAHLLNDDQRNQIAAYTEAYARLQFGGASRAQLDAVRGHIEQLASGYGMHGVSGQLLDGNAVLGGMAGIDTSAPVGPRDRAPRGGGGGGASADQLLERAERRGQILLEQRRMMLEYTRVETPLLREHGETRDHYEQRFLAHLQAQNEALRTQREALAEQARDLGAHVREAQRALDARGASGAGDAFRGGTGLRGQQTADALGGGLQGASQEMSRLEQAQQRAADTQRQFRDAFQLNADQTLTAAQRMAQGTRGAYDAMSGAATSHFRLLLQHREDLGQALAGMAHDMTESLATQAFGQMLWETAQGIAALAGVATAPLAPGHFAAAAAYAAVAALAGGVAYATAPSTGGGSATQATPPGSNGAFASAGGLGSGRGGDAPAPIVINVNSALATRSDVQDVVRQAQNGSFRRNQRSDLEALERRRRAT